MINPIFQIYVIKWWHRRWHLPCESDAILSAQKSALWYCCYKERKEVKGMCIKKKSLAQCPCSNRYFVFIFKTCSSMWVHHKYSMWSLRGTEDATLRATYSWPPLHISTSSWTHNLYFIKSTQLSLPVSLDNLSSINRHCCQNMVLRNYILLSLNQGYYRWSAQ